MNDEAGEHPEWVTRGKTIKQLIKELRTFDDQDLEVRISIDDGTTFKCISLVKKHSGESRPFCGLVNCE